NTSARATAPPATATATWPASSARPPWWPAEPIPSSVPGIGASPNGEVTNAIVAVGRSILVIIWHLLASDDARFTDLGADHFTKHLDPDAKKRNHIRQLEALGYTVTL